MIDNQIRFLLSILKNKKSILEVGCKAGELTKKLFDLGYDITGIDNDIRLIRKAKKGNKIKFLYSDLKKYDFINKYDAIIYFNNTFINDFYLIFNEMYIHTNNNGLIIIDFYFEEDKYLKEIENIIRKYNINYVIVSNYSKKLYNNSKNFQFIIKKL